MNHDTAHTLLDQIRAERPDLYSKHYWDREATTVQEWYIQIGQGESEVRLYQAAQWPAWSAAHPPDEIPDAWRFDPTQPGESTLPWYTRGLASLLDRAPDPLAHFLWMRIAIPLCEGVTRACHPWMVLARRRGWRWLEKLIVEATWWVPLYPVYVIRRDMAAQIFKALIQTMGQGEMPPVGELRTTELDGGATKVHIVRLDTPDSAEAIRQAEALIRQIKGHDD